MTSPSSSRINELAREVNSLHPDKIIQFADDDLHAALQNSESANLFWQKYIAHKITQAGITTPSNVPHLSPEQSYHFAVKIHDANVQSRTDKHALETAVKELEIVPIKKGRFTMIKHDKEQESAAAAPSPEADSPTRKGRFTITKPKTPSPPPSAAGVEKKGRFTVTKPQKVDRPPSPSPFKKSP